MSRLKEIERILSGRYRDPRFIAVGVGYGEIKILNPDGSTAKTRKGKLLAVLPENKILYSLRSGLVVGDDGDFLEGLIIWDLDSDTIKVIFKEYGRTNDAFIYN